MKLCSGYRRRDSLQCLTSILILSLCVCVTGSQVIERANLTAQTNLTEQYHLCKSASQIDALQQQYDLIRVNSTATHAALQPGWPETLITLALSLYTFIAALIFDGRSKGFLGLISNLLIPLALLLDWTVSFSIAQRNMRSAGWVSTTWITAFNAYTSSGLYVTDNETSFLGGMIFFFVIVPLVMLQFAGSVAMVHQRWSSDYGSVAYNISDAHGCVPFTTFAYLEQGVRAHAFKVVQTTQVVWACVAVLGTAAWKMGNRGDIDEEDAIGRWLLAIATAIISIPLLIYEIVIATRGTPVVISGNCMLVELNPRFGFLNSDIDNGWKALVGMSGL